MIEILLAIIAGLILVKIVKTDNPHKADSFIEALSFHVISYLIPLIVAVVWAAVVLLVAGFLSSLFGFN